MKKYLIAFDLDGTVLPEVRTLSERTVRAVKMAGEQGHIVVLSSARPMTMMGWVYKRMGLKTAVSSINGAYIFNPSDKSFPEKEYTISKEHVKNIYDLCISDGAVPLYIEYRNALWYVGDKHNPYYGERVITSVPSVRLDENNKLPDTCASRIILSPSTPESVEKVLGYVNRFDEMRPSVWNIGAREDGKGCGKRISIGPKQADKWLSLKYIADYYNIPVSDCYAFGDSWNDYGMIDNAGHGYALKGSVAEREGHTKNLTRLSCVDDGVADMIEREILNK